MTFGVNLAPYMAIRVLHQLVDDVHLELPIYSNFLRNFMYIDDIVAGIPEIE